MAKHFYAVAKKIRWMHPEVRFELETYFRTLVIFGTNIFAQLLLCDILPLL